MPSPDFLAKTEITKGAPFAGTATVMDIISKANETVLTILGKPKAAASGYRLLHFCAEHRVDEGILLYNLLTKELVLLTEEENNRLTELDYLKDHWFVVPQETKDREYADLVKWVVMTRQKKSDIITNYTIFTTTDCNARCFYCFELGRSRIPMSKETALKVVQYIKNHCGGKKVNISWFGGEPLFNMEAIDIICNGLRQQGVEYASTMVTNGYLFDDVAVQKAVENWNLKKVQISLDGTEAVYNKAKAYIYKEGNPYQIVLDNIGRLLDAAITVRIRLNMDLYNAQNLLLLVDELARRFSGKSGIYIYAHHLFDINQPMAELHNDQGWTQRSEAMRVLTEKIAEYNMAERQGIEKNIKMHHCMADSGNAVTIAPTGDIGLCEHFSEDEFIGHIDTEGFDSKVVASWKETSPEILECAECFAYPACIRLKKCTNEAVCFPLLRQGKLRKTKREMQYEFEQWKNKND